MPLTQLWLLNMGFHYLRPFAKLLKANISFGHVCLSVRLHGTTRLSLDGFSWNLILEYFSKICRENSSFINIWQEKRVLYVNFWSCLAQLFLEWEIFQTNVVEKIKTHILCSFFFSENRDVYEIMRKKYRRSRQATDDNMAHGIWYWIWCFFDRAS